MNNSKILFIDSSYPINTRNEKIISSLQAHGYGDIVVVTWDRLNKQKEKVVIENNVKYFLYKKYAKPGEKIAKLKFFFQYVLFVKSLLKVIKPKIIIASHWDSLFIGSLLKKRNQIIIYENLDIPTSDNIIILKILQQIERFSLRKTDCIIHASRFFVDLYPNYKGMQFVLENKPLIKKDVEIESNLNKDKIVLSFIGNIRYFEILENLINAVKRIDNILLNFYGDGIDYDKVVKFAKDVKNIKVHGRYDYSDISNLYCDSHIIWAAYPNNDHNVKYAISNKFHESLYYNRPCVFASETKLGDFVKVKNIGFVVNPYSENDIYILLKSICENKELIKNVKSNILFYNRSKSSWSSDFLKIETYLKTVR